MRDEKCRRRTSCRGGWECRPWIWVGGELRYCHLLESVSQCYSKGHGSRGSMAVIRSSVGVGGRAT
eukprot:scaffold18176_cov54-Cyclotella_meneghiniana.AAC.2